MLLQDAQRPAAFIDRLGIAVRLREHDRRTRRLAPVLLRERGVEDRLCDPHRLLHAPVADAVHDYVVQVDEDEQVVRLPHVPLQLLGLPRERRVPLADAERRAVHLAREVEEGHLADGLGTAARPRHAPLERPVQAFHLVARRGARPLALAHALDLLRHVSGRGEVLRHEHVPLFVWVRVQVPQAGKHHGLARTLDADDRNLFHDFSIREQL